MPKGDQKNNMTEVELLEKKIRKLEERQKKLEERIKQMELIFSFKTEESDDNDLKFIVTNVLHELGIPTNFNGYHYLRSAIIMGVKDIKSIEFMTKGLYPDIAKLYNTTPGRIERGMRHSIEIAILRGNSNLFNRMFRYAISSSKRKPTNSEFIATIVDYIRLQKGTV